MMISVSGPTMLRIRRVVSMPFISGIFQSIRQISYPLPRWYAVRISLTASAPLSTHFAWIPNFFKSSEA